MAKSNGNNGNGVKKAALRVPVTSVTETGYGFYIYVGDDAVVGDVKSLGKYLEKVLKEKFERYARHLRISIATNDDQLLVNVNFDCHTLPNEVREEITKITDPRYSGSASAHAEVVRDDDGRHIGTLATINFESTPPKDALDTVRGIDGVDRADSRNGHRSSVQFSLTDPTRDQDEIDTVVRRVTEALRLRVPEGKVSVSDDAEKALLSSLDYDPAYATA